MGGASFPESWETGGLCIHLRYNSSFKIAPGHGSTCKQKEYPQFLLHYFLLCLCTMTQHLVCNDQAVISTRVKNKALIGSSHPWQLQYYYNISTFYYKHICISSFTDVFTCLQFHCMARWFGSRSSAGFYHHKGQNKKSRSDILPKRRGVMLAAMLVGTSHPLRRQGDRPLPLSGLETRTALFLDTLPQIDVISCCH